MMRLLRFTSVGLLSLAIKLGTLTVLVNWASFNYLLATAFSVEAALVHGFLWHHNWTWRDRRHHLHSADIVFRLLRYHAVTGILAMTANLTLMRLLVGTVGLHYLIAGFCATVLAGLANYFISDFFVFVTPRHWRQSLLRG